MVDPSTLEFDVSRPREEIVLVVMQGDLDLATVSQARKLAGDLVNEGAVFHVYDLEGVENIDSSGIGFFLGIWSELQKQGGAVMIAGAGDYITGIFDLVHLGERVPLHPDRLSAVESMSSRVGQRGQGERETRNTA